MARLGYGALPPEALVGFQVELDQGAWKGVRVERYENGEHPLHEAPVRVFWKVSMRAGIAEVIAAQSLANEVAACDIEWDQAQRSFVFAVQHKTVARDPRVARAAQEVQKTLCMDGSTAMTGLDADAEVNFARNQLALAKTPAVAQNLALLGLDDELERIRTTTDDLARAIGRGDDTSARQVSRSRRILKATAACAVTFNHVHEGVEALVAQTADPATQAELRRLLAPMERLLAQKPEAASDAPANDTDATEPVAPAEPLKRVG